MKQVKNMVLFFGKEDYLSSVAVKPCYDRTTKLRLMCQKQHKIHVYLWLGYKATIKYLF